MTALAADAKREKRGALIRTLEVVAATDICYAGAAAVSNAAGYAAPATATAFDRFLGVFSEQCDNSGGSAGDLKAKIDQYACMRWTGSGFSQASVGDDVWFSDDQTITLTAGNCYAGTVVEYISTTEVWVNHMPAYNAASAVIMNCTAQAVSMTVTALPANARGVRFAFTCATPAMTDGYGAVEIDLTVSGVATGHASAASTWVNMAGTATLPSYTFCHNDGIWDGGATLTTAYISWAKYQCLLASNPAWCSIWELNFDGANSEIDSIFNVNNPALALGYQAGTPTKAAVGSIPFCSTAGGTIRYIYLYDAADSD
jgi:hypothetical protein